MPPIQEPTGAYRQRPQHDLVECPHCNKILNHHLAAGQVSVDVNGNSGAPPPQEKPRRQLLSFSSPAEAPHKQPPALAAEDREPAVSELVLPEEEPPEYTPKQLRAIALGDVVVTNPPPEIPKIVGEFEQVKTGQARPEKQAAMKIPGYQSPTPAANNAAADVQDLDHPLIGGKVTICVLLYGEEYFNLHKRCLNSICSTVPEGRMDLRVGCNQVGLQTLNYLKKLPVKKLYVHSDNRLKYPVMREMFWDEEHPIDTRFVVWFDDDSYVLDPNWLTVLAKTIAKHNPKDRVAAYGHELYHPLQSPAGKSPMRWFQNASWWRGRPLRDRRGRESPNGDKIFFPVGGFWAMSLEAIRACDIPDTRLANNGGDVCIGEALHQNGFKTKTFNEKKQFIKTSGAPRRGVSQGFLWYK